MDCRRNTVYEGAKRTISRAIDVIPHYATHHAAILNETIRHTCHPERNEVE
ncbi:MAG: hypothetical protein ACOYIF_06270 [Acetivibrionales bacterium]